MRYVSDGNGQVQAVQIPIEEWDKLGEQVRKYEQMLKLKKDLSLAFAQVERMRKGVDERSRLGDQSGLEQLLLAGPTATPKQLKVIAQNRKGYAGRKLK